MKINSYAVNQADKGTVIYDANEQINSVCIIIKGRVLAVNNGSKLILGSGNFLGVSDLYAGKYLYSYVAYDDVTFYCFPIQNKEELTEIFAANKDYKGIIVASLTRYINELDKIYKTLQPVSDQLCDFIYKKYDTYLQAGKNSGYAVANIQAILDMQNYTSEFVLDEKKLLFYKECVKIPLDTWKSFCSSGDEVALYFIEEASDLIAQLIAECTSLSTYLYQIFDGLMSNSQTCLFKEYAALAINLEESGGYNGEIIKTVDEIIDQINIVEKLFDEKLGRKINVDRGKMEEIYYLLLSKNSDRKEQVENNFQYSQSETKQVMEELKGSLKQIYEFGNIDNGKFQDFNKCIIDFMNLKDKFSTEDHCRILRKKIMQQFYEVYEAVFFNALNYKELPRVIDLFLKYGYMDERLFQNEQLKELYFLENDMPVNEDPCKVYNIKEWLLSIYKGEKEPSKNEFDLEYVDTLRDRRKRGDITDEQVKELHQSPKDKVIYEIHNLYRYNHRVVNGQIITFVPFLWGENLVKSLKTLFVTGARVNETLKELLQVDYSVFHREVMYINNEKGISKEYVTKEVFPDIILMPTLGYHGVMWQEISGKRKSNEGRFLLPAFTEISLKDMLVKVLGRFRWELCRSIQGSAWNNIKYKSLTSEYADYIQFYRKNRDLSEEMKEKLKNQIQKGKGNYREIFVIDYEAWIKGEVNGTLRLNRVAREILATYCPFSKPIRERLNGQPLFADAMGRYQREKLKKVKELDLRYRAIEKDGGELTDELMNNMIFYRDM